MACHYCDLEVDSPPEHAEGCPIRIYDEKGTSCFNDAVMLFETGYRDVGRSSLIEPRFAGNHSYLLGWNQGATKKRISPEWMLSNGGRRQVV